MQALCFDSECVAERAVADQKGCLPALKVRAQLMSELAIETRHLRAHAKPFPVGRIADDQAGLEFGGRRCLLQASAFHSDVSRESCIRDVLARRLDRARIFIKAE